MAANDLCFQPISQLCERIKKREVSPVEVTQAYLNRIQETDPQLNSYITVTADRALQEAREAEAQLSQNKHLGPLHGIPLAHKDIVATKGIKTTCGSKVLKDEVSDYDATVIQRLRAAGAILLGKLNMNEFATMIPSPFFFPVTVPALCAFDREGGVSGLPAPPRHLWTPASRDIPAAGARPAAGLYPFLWQV